MKRAYGVVERLTLLLEDSPNQGSIFPERLPAIALRNPLKFFFQKRENFFANGRAAIAHHSPRVNSIRKIAPRPRKSARRKGRESENR
jgi:hypothetical protein